MRVTDCGSGTDFIVSGDELAATADVLTERVRAAAQDAGRCAEGFSDKRDWPNRTFDEAHARVCVLVETLRQIERAKTTGDGVMLPDALRAELRDGAKVQLAYLADCRHARDFREAHGTGSDLPYYAAREQAWRTLLDRLGDSPA